MEIRALSFDADQTLWDFRHVQRFALEDVRQRAFDVFLQRRGHPDLSALAAILVEHFLAVRFQEIRLYAEVPAVLARLKGRSRLGLLTNSNTYPERCGLPNTFDAVVLGPSYGLEKPARAAFEMIADRLHVEPSMIAHIGDDWDDIEGANMAGCVSILMDREHHQPSFSREADHIVSDLTELEVLLNAFTKTARSSDDDLGPEGAPERFGPVTLGPDVIEWTKTLIV